jgi:hypothetical protein
MTMGQAVYTVLMGVVAFLGLIFASQAQDDGFMWFGYLLIAFGIVNLFVMIHRTTGHPPGR